MLKIILKNTSHGASILSATITTFTPPPNTTQQGQNKTVNKTSEQTDVRKLERLYKSEFINET